MLSPITALTAAQEWMVITMLEAAFGIPMWQNAIKDMQTQHDVHPVNQWISVKDRLPENCIEVLVYDTDCGIVIGWYDKEIGDFAADFISPLDAVTHWQPLPEKPQD